MKTARFATFILLLACLACASRSTAYLSIWLDQVWKGASVGAQEGVGRFMDHQVMTLVERMACIQAAGESGYVCLGNKEESEPTVEWASKQAFGDRCKVRKERKISSPILRLVQADHFRDLFQKAQVELAEMQEAAPQNNQVWFSLDTEIREINETYKHGFVANLRCREPKDKKKVEYRLLVGARKDEDRYQLLYVCKVSLENDCKGSYFELF